MTSSWEVKSTPYLLSLGVLQQTWSHSTLGDLCLELRLSFSLPAAWTLPEKVCKQNRGPVQRCARLPPNPSLPGFPVCTYQLASGGRPCTHRAAGPGDREWPVEQHWLAAGGEGGGRAEKSERSVRRSRTRARLRDRCSPQINPRPHHTGTVAGQEGESVVKTTRRPSVPEQLPSAKRFLRQTLGM